MLETPTLVASPSSDLIARAKAGDQVAWNALFEECYPKILRVVRRRLSRQMRTHLDSTDIANEVMKSLALRFDEFDFESMTDLRRFVLHAAQQKVVDHYRHEHAQKRDISRERSLTGENGSMILEPVGDCPTPSQVVVAIEEKEQLLARQTGEARTVLELRIQGLSKPEVAREIGWSLRSVERFLKNLGDGLRR